MKKEQREYLNKYGDIPKDDLDRYLHMISKMRTLARQKETIGNAIKRIESIQWKTISYVLYVIPKGTPRPRSGRNGVFYVKGAADNKKLMESFLKDEDITLIKTAVKFECDSYVPIPHSMTKLEQLLAELKFIRPLTTPDFDNLAKGYCDMIQGLLILNDSQVIDGRSRKYYSAKPRVEIRLSYMEDFDSDFNRKKILKKGR